MKRYVTIAEYGRMTGLAYPTIKNACETGQLKAIRTEAGYWKIDTDNTENTDTDGTEDPDDSDETHEDDHSDEEDEEDFDPEIDDIYKVLLPTNATLDFTLDPMGLSYLSDNDQGMTLEELKNRPWSGRIDFQNDTLIIINESSFDLLVYLDIAITGDAIAKSSPALVNVPAPDSSDDTNPNIFIGMEIFDVYNASDNNVEVIIKNEHDTGRRPALFVLKKAEYIVTQEDDGTYSHKMVEGTGSGIKLLFGGVCNPHGDWSDFIASSSYSTPESSVGIHAVYTIGKVDDSYSFVPGAHGLVDNGISYISPHSPIETAGFIYDNHLIESITDTDYAELATMTAHIAIPQGEIITNIPFDFSGFTIESFIIYNDYNILPSYVPFYDENRLEIYFSIWPEGGPEGYDIWIKLSNANWYALWVTIVPP